MTVVDRELQSLPVNHNRNSQLQPDAAGGNSFATAQIPTRIYRVRSAPLLWLALPFAAGIGTGITFADWLTVWQLVVCATLLGVCALLVSWCFNEEPRHPASCTPQAPAQQTTNTTEQGVQPTAVDKPQVADKSQAANNPSATDKSQPILKAPRLSAGLHAQANSPEANTRRTASPLQLLWALLFVACAFMCGAAYALLREPSAGPALEVPREAILTLEIQRLFAANRADGFVSGIGEVLEAPAYLPNMSGQKVSFSVWTKPTFTRDYPPLLSGSQILVKGRLSDFDAPPPPPRRDHDLRKDRDARRVQTTDRGSEGFRDFLRSQGVRYGIDSGSIVSVEHAGSIWRQLCERIRTRLQVALSAGVNNETTQRLANIGSAMLLGDTSLLPQDDRSAFTISGTMHLFAVSGLHVVLIAAAFAAAGEFCDFPRLRVAILGILLLWVYVQVVGAPPSATRAWWMSSLFWAAVTIRRQHSPLSALCASMLIILLINPRDLFSVGFQLSYSVVAGILLYALPLTTALENWTLQRLDAAHLRLRRYPLLPPRLWYTLPEHRRRNLLSLFTISLVGTLYSTPLVLGVFGNFAPAGLLVNLLLVPLAFWVLCALLLACAFGLPGLLSVASLFNHAAWLLLAFMSWVAALTLASPIGFYTGLAWKWPNYGITATFVLLTGSFAAHTKVFDKRPLVKFSLVPLLWLALLLAGLAGST